MRCHVYQKESGAMNEALSDNDKSWYLKVIKAPEAWEITRGSEKITIAIVDNGFNLKHPELASKVVGPYNVWKHSSEIFPQQVDHGTHVAGIIGAVRNNNIGMDGIVDKVKIMFIRAVPGGDEHDKDIALSIRYAVNNGAKIINMSFGKPVSPYKQFVDDAVKYAALNGVLVVHAAGNDGLNIDKEPFYPNPVFIDGTKATNFLTVGASGDYSIGGLVAPFSNYGNGVDIFAPGEYINSTTFGNGYEPYDGTSMASPVAAGVAGLIKSYFPNITPSQMIDLLKKTGTPIKETVTQPGSDNKVLLSQLCNSGTIINAAEAVKMAIKLYGKY